MHSRKGRLPAGVWARIRPGGGRERPARPLGPRKRRGRRSDMAGTRGGVGRIAGTRGGIGRIAAMAVGLAVVLALVLADAARAGTYAVAQCGWRVGRRTRPGFRGHLRAGFVADPAALRCRRERPAAGAAAGSAAAADGQDGSGAGSLGRAAGDHLHRREHQVGREAAAGLRGPSGLRRRDPNSGTLASGAGSATGTGIGAFRPAWRSQIPGGGCGGGGAAGLPRPLHPLSPPRWLWLSGLTFTVLDPRRPATRIGGPLLAPGWHRGTAPLEIDATIRRRRRPRGSERRRHAGPRRSPPALRHGDDRRRAARDQAAPCPATARSGPRCRHHEARRRGPRLAGLRGRLRRRGQGCAADAQIEVDNSPPGDRLRRRRGKDRSRRP